MSNLSIYAVRSSDLVLFRDVDGAFKTNITVSLFKGVETKVPFGIECQIKENDTLAWRSIPLLPPSAQEFKIWDVEVGTTYNIRCRLLYTDGSNGPWVDSWDDSVALGTSGAPDAIVNTHKVVGNTFIPRNVDTFTAQRIGNGPIELDWTIAAIPPSIASFELRYGLTQDWDSMTYLDRVLANRYEIQNLPNGTYYFAIKVDVWAVDVTVPKLFNESADPVYAGPITILGGGKLPGCFLGGSVSSFTWNTTDSKLINYTESSQWDWEDQNDIDPVAGEITVPESGYYKLTAVVLGNQGNTNKEEWGEIRLDIQGGSNPGRLTIAMVDIPTDKTSLRNMVSVATRYLEKDQVLSLYMWASTGLGTFNMDRCTFEIKAESLE